MQVKYNELLMQFDLSGFEIDKYLKWYEEITIALQSYPSKRKRLYRLEKVCNSLGKRGGKMVLSGHHTFTRKLAEYFNKEKEKLYQEVSDIFPYTNDIIKAEDIILDNTNNTIFIPSLTDWEYLHFCRQSYLKDNQTEYSKGFQRSILKDKDFASFQLDELYKNVFDSDFYGSVITGIPILNSVITGHTFNDVSGWKIFCHWICKIDYAKWLLTKTKGFGKYESVVIPTIAGVLLLFHYLDNNNGASLYDPQTLEKASIKYNLSKPRLKRGLSKFRQNEITMVGKTTNEKSAKLNAMRFAIRELQTTGNKNATNEALKDLEVIEQKIKKMT